MQASLNTVHLEPLSREAALDRSPWVERSGTLGPRPCEGSPGRGQGVGKQTDARASAAERCVAAVHLMPKKEHAPFNQNALRNCYLNSIEASLDSHGLMDLLTH